jgi:hypothetical protein
MEAVLPAMEQLAREHAEATFLVIYVREAHPAENQRPHRSLAGSAQRRTSWP